MELENQLSGLQSELKAHFAKAAEEKSQFGTMLNETKTAIDNLQKQVDAIDAKMAARHTGEATPSLIDTLKENDDVQRLIRAEGKGSSVVISLKGAQVAQIMERKTTITSGAVGAQTTGVLAIERTPGIVAEARQALTVRNLLASRPTTMQVLDFVRVNSPMAKASPQVEASASVENAVTFTAASEKVKTISTWAPATRQILSDFGELAGFLNSSLAYYTDAAVETELLSGDGTGEHLNGLVTLASDFDSGLFDAADGWNKLDVVSAAVQQIEEAKEISPTFVVMAPRDVWQLRRLKDNQGRYIFGDPQSDAPFSLWGLNVVKTTSMANGHFLVGSGSNVVAEIRDREEMQIELSTQHSDFFTKGLVAVRSECRLALVTYRPGAFVQGQFSQSPA